MNLKYYTLLYPYSASTYILCDFECSTPPSSKTLENIEVVRAANLHTPNFFGLDFTKELKQQHSQGAISSKLMVYSYHAFTLVLE